jgi:BioD-like phosphotransacetylase family protein
VITNQHAARLREMAETKDLLAKSYAETAPDVSAAYKRRFAALLAGAEALEAVEVAKAALQQIVTNRIGDVGMCGSRHCDCSECVATAALARLEGK